MKTVLTIAQAATLGILASKDVIVEESKELEDTAARVREVYSSFDIAVDPSESRQVRRARKRRLEKVVEQKIKQIEKAKR